MIRGFYVVVVSLLLTGCQNASKPFWDFDYSYGSYNECKALGSCVGEGKKVSKSMACEVMGICEPEELSEEEKAGQGGSGAGSGYAAPGVGIDGSTPGGAPGHDDPGHHDSGTDQH